MMWIWWHDKGMFQVGYYEPLKGFYNSAYPFDTLEEAENKVHYLNGGNNP